MAARFASVKQREVLPFWDGYTKIHRDLHCDSSVINNLALDRVLEGHRGCVNCLEWSRDGHFLATGSDDLNAIIWDVDRMCEATQHTTGHSGNIFSVKADTVPQFVHETQSRQLLTCADDRQVRHHDLVAKEPLSVWHCSTARVKRLATLPSEPALIWSAAEDGLVRQYDLREPHHCQPGQGAECRNVVVDTHHTAIDSQCKCIDANPVRAEMLAVGCMDAFVRVYDRRVFTRTTAATKRDMRSQPACVAYVAPGHLSALHQAVPGNLAITYVAFSCDGSELVVNMSEENVYLYNVLHWDDPIRYNLPSSTTQGSAVAPPTRQHPVAVRIGPTKTHSDRQHQHGMEMGTSIKAGDGEDIMEEEFEEDEGRQPEERGRNGTKGPPMVEALKKEGNNFFRSKKYFEAVQRYSEAISASPSLSVLYANRAAAYLARKWEGDSYCALRDCEVSLELDSSNQKAAMRRILSLCELGWSKEAEAFFSYFEASKPDKSPEVENLRKKMDIILKRKGSGNGRLHERSPPDSPLQVWEQLMRKGAHDHCQRFCGHWNTHTDIKEATFLGQHGSYIGAGSDDGRVFIWEKSSGKLVRVLKGDSQIVNCVQWHPSRVLLATSGIDSVVRIWSPQVPHGEQEEVVEEEKFGEICRRNQHGMKLDPFSYMLMHMGHRIPMQDGDIQSGSDDEGEGPGQGGGARLYQIQPVNCRQS